MPTDEEKKEQDAADNDISDEITDSEKADNAELTDVLKIHRIKQIM